MLKKNVPNEEQMLLDAIKRALEELKQYTPGETKYETVLESVGTLYGLLDQLRASRTSGKNWIPVAGHIGGIFLIVLTESLGHVVTSKALNLTSSFRK